jgi:hypothetical protein
MKKKDELLKKVPESGFLKVAGTEPATLPKDKRALLIRKGNELFNQEQIELAKKIFLTTGYTDGLIRLGDYYLGKNQALEAFRMYWLAPYPKRVDWMLERMVLITKEWLKE